MPDLERISLGETCDIKRKMAQGLAKNARTIVIVFLLKRNKVQKFKICFYN